MWILVLIAQIAVPTSDPDHKSWYPVEVHENIGDYSSENACEAKRNAYLKEHPENFVACVGPTE